MQKLAFGKSSKKIEREIEQLELALVDLLVAVAKDDDAPINEGQDEPSPEAADAPGLRRRPRVSDATPRECRELDTGACCPDCGGDLRVPHEADDYMRTFGAMAEYMRTFGATGEDVSELLDMIAAQMKVIQIARIKKSCRCCKRMMQEPAPSRPIPGSMAGPNLLAHVPPLGDASIACQSTDLEVRRSPAFASPARDLRPHGGRHPRKHPGRLVRTGHGDLTAAY